VRLPDRPGSPASVLNICASNDANVIEVQHVREGIPLHPRETGIQLVLEVRDDQHAKQIISLTQQIS
jgi:threonine dehydratase